VSRAFVIVRVPGPAWNHDRPMREQDGWDDHARFMDALAEEGFIVLGGPLGDGERRFMHVCDAPDEAAIRGRLDADPWTPDMLELETVEPWEVLLRALR
jgi:uncharacterized protein YciI